MIDLLDEIDRALGVHLYQLALAGALAVPDIAAALAAPDGVSTRDRYAAWFDENVGPEYPSLEGSTVYRFRCSLLHQGTMEDQKPPLQYRRLVFMDPRVNAFLHQNVINDMLNLDVRAFSMDVTRAARTWFERVKETEPVRTHFARCVRYRPEGFAGFTNAPAIA